MDRPDPNGPPVPLPGGGTVEYRVCECCQPTKKVPNPKSKHRFFVRNSDGDVVCMAHDWEQLCESKGWK